MRNLRTIILAAGKGTRMKSDVPKVLHRISGKPILQYVLSIAQAVGSAKTYFVLGHKSDVIQSEVGQDATIVLQKKQLGTADAVKSTMSYFRTYNGNVLILCGDTPLLNKSTIKAMLRKHDKGKAMCTCLTAVVHNPQGYGRIIRDESGAIVAIREDKDAEGFERNIAEINVGVYCFKSKELFKALREVKLNEKKSEFYLTDLIEQFVSNGLKVDTLETEDPTEGLGINTREDIAAAEAIIRKRTLKEFMLKGVTILDPNTTYIDADAIIGKDTVIKPFSVIENNVKIGSHCSIGPFARIRPGVRVGNNVEIGNFTEVSRSKIGNKTLIKHFSFLGDANVGANVNIGAGTVTANYDGTEKNVTKISNGAFIGSDAILVAPVKIGQKSIVGAGSVVTKGKSIPDGAVAVGVPAQVTSRRKRA